MRLKLLLLLLLLMKVVAATMTQTELILNDMQPLQDVPVQVSLRTVRPASS
jgi:hypothetical protein